MSGLHEAFDEIVADVPAYGDLDRAIEQADLERRHRNGLVVGLTAAAAVLVVIAGLVAVSRDTDTAPPVSPRPTPVTPSPTPSKSQSPQTWVDSAVATHAGHGWDVPDPLKGARDAWFAVAADHLDPRREHLEAQASSPWGGIFERPVEGSVVPIYGRIGLMVDRGDGSLFDDGCRHLHGQPETDGTESCSTERLKGPHGEAVRISRYRRQCGAYEGPGPAPATCGDYSVAVAVARRDGLIGFIIVDGRGTPELNPFAPDAMAAAAADPRLTLPASAYALPSDQTVVSALQDHFPGFRVGDQVFSVGEHPGKAQAWGDLGRLELRVDVWPAGRTPACGRSWLIECFERRVFGADDPTTVLVGAWDEEHWADRPKNSRAASRGFVYVGPRHTVVVHETRIVLEDEKTRGEALDKRLIDLVLDPRLQ